ncbi:MAG: DoxX family protein [Planctomycetota bacterium]|nr:DoxX family protein [Planctomycetota bacterium]
MAKPSISTNDLGLLFMRLTLGAIFVVHGIGKVMAFEGFSKNIAGIGLEPSGLLAVCAVAAELGGGLLLILGIFPRIGALSIGAVMAAAIVLVHGQHGFGLVFRATAEEIARWKDVQGAKIVPNGVEYNLALLAMCVHLVLVGGGKISLLRSEKRG